jgi:putative FmdB family regulatory protein
MPFYDYQAIEPEAGCEHCSEPFEVRQKRTDPRLEVCPECGAPVRRLLSGVSIGKSKKLALKTLQKAGFTQYNNAGSGEYERVSGSNGPDAIVHDTGD